MTLRRTTWAAALSALCLSVTPALATTFTLSDANSVLQVNAGGPQGAFNWTVDGVDILNQQWFWFRVGNAPEQSIDTLPVIASKVSDGLTCSECQLDVLYQGDRFTIETKYSLLGGEPGSRTADIGEQIRIVNQRNVSLDFHFYQYSDFDVSRSGGDVVEIDSNHFAASQQAELGASMLSQTTSTPPPTHVQAGVGPAIFGKLNDASPTVLNDVLVAGPGNANWAFEWDTLIPRRGSYLISLDKSVTPIPEPAALVFAATALLIGFARRRKLP